MTEKSQDPRPRGATWRYYELWFEYLKEAPRYRPFCDPGKRVVEMPAGEDSEVFFRLSRLSAFFGDVVNESFEAIWANRLRQHVDIPSICSNGIDVAAMALGALAYWKERKGESLTPRECLEELQRVCRESGVYLVAVRQEPHDTNTVVKAFDTYLRAINKKKADPLSGCNFRPPRGGQKRLDSWQRYLDVHRAHTPGLGGPVPWPEVARRIFNLPKGKKPTPDQCEQVKEWHGRFKEILAHVDQGFPLSSCYS